MTQLQFMDLWMATLAPKIFKIKIQTQWVMLQWLRLQSTVDTKEDLGKHAITL